MATHCSKFREQEGSESCCYQDFLHVSCKHLVEHCENRILVYVGPLAWSRIILCPMIYVNYAMSALEHIRLYSAICPLTRSVYDEQAVIQKNKSFITKLLRSFVTFTGTTGFPEKSWQITESWCCILWSSINSVIFQAIVLKPMTTSCDSR